MEPYNKNLPFIRFANDGKTVLDRMVESGIPLTRALQYFRDNPEGNALEFFKLIGEDIIPFYGNYRNGGSASDYAKEAALMFSPARGKTRRPVRVDANGVPNMHDLGKWYDNKINQIDRVNDKVYARDPAYEVQKLQDEITRVNSSIETLEEMKNSPEYSPLDKANFERYQADDAAKLKSLTEQLNNKTLEILDYNGMTIKDFHKNFGDPERGSPWKPGETFIERALEREYGPDNVMEYKRRAWEALDDINGFDDYNR